MGREEEESEENRKEEREENRKGEREEKEREEEERIDCFDSFGSLKVAPKVTSSVIDVNKQIDTILDLV